MHSLEQSPTAIADEEDEEKGGGPGKRAEEDTLYQLSAMPNYRAYSIPM